MTREEHWINELTHLAEEHGTKSCAILLCERLEDPFDEEGENQVTSPLGWYFCRYSQTRLWEIVNQNRSSSSTSTAIDLLSNMHFEDRELVRLLVDILDDPQYDEWAKAESLWTLARLHPWGQTSIIPPMSEFAKWALHHEHPGIRQGGIMMSCSLKENKDRVEELAQFDDEVAFGFATKDHAQEMLSYWNDGPVENDGDSSEADREQEAIMLAEAEAESRTCPHFELHAPARPVPPGAQLSTEKFWKRELTWFANEYGPIWCSLHLSEGFLNQSEETILVTIKHLRRLFCIHSQKKLAEIVLRYPNPKVKLAAINEMHGAKLKGLWSVKFFLHIWADPAFSSSIKASALNHLSSIFLFEFEKTYPELRAICRDGLKHPSAAVRQAAIRLSRELKLHRRIIKRLAVCDHSIADEMLTSEVAQEALDSWN